MTLPIYPDQKCLDKSSIAWPFLLVFVALLLGNNLFTKITLLLCLIYFSFANWAALKNVHLVISRAPALVLFQIWAAASIVWSVVPKVTLDLVLTQLAFFVLALLMAYDVLNKNLGQTLRYAAITVIVLVVLFAMAFPGAAVSSNGFKAFYANKNNLGIVMAVCILILLFAERPRWFDYVLTCIAFVFLILSQSKTSLSITIVCVVMAVISTSIGHIYANLDRYLQGIFNMLGNAFAVFAYSLIFLAVYFRDYIAGSLIKVIPYDFLTGRGELWVTVLRRTEEDLLWGLGPGSFWQAGKLSEIAQTSLLIKHPLWIEKLGSADGGYIDIIGSLGFIGLALLFCSIFNNYRNLITLKVRYFSLLLSFITFFMLHNLTETTAYHSTNSLWFVYIFSTFYIVLSGLNFSKNMNDKKQMKFAVPNKHGALNEQ